MFFIAFIYVSHFSIRLTFSVKRRDTKNARNAWYKRSLSITAEVANLRDYKHFASTSLQKTEHLFTMASSFLGEGLARHLDLPQKGMIMKRVIFSAFLLFGTAVFASAQTATGNSSTTTGVASSTSAKKKSKKARPSEVLNNRKIYHFKNGQRSTPTGNEATPVGGGYSALGGNREASIPKGDTVATKAKAANKTKNRKQ